MSSEKTGAKGDECMMLSDATQNRIHSFVVRKDIQRSKKWWRMQEKVILSFVVRKNIPAGNNSAECKESHSLFCSQKIHAKLENPVSKTTRVSPSNIIDSFRVRNKWRVQRNVIPSFVLS